MQKNYLLPLQRRAVAQAHCGLRRLIFLICLALGALPGQNRLMAQSTNPCTATLLNAVNASTCTPGTTFNISGSGSNPETRICFNSAAAANNWGKFIACSTTARISYLPAASRDAVVYAYKGSCNSLTYLSCADAGANGVQENISLSGLTPGDTIFVRVIRKGSTNSMSGNICVASPYTIQTGAISGGPFCAGTTISVPFTSFGTFTGNTYTVQLSDAAGSFASPVSIGTLGSNANSGTISATLPTGTAAGSGYRIRVISNGPVVTGTDNGSNLSIQAAPQGIFAGNTLCGSGTPELRFNATAGAGNFDIIYNDGSGNRTATDIPSGSAFSPFILPLVTSNYTLVSVTDANGCTRSSGFTDGTATITISTTPTISASAAAASRCFSTGALTSSLSYLSTTGSPNQYSITWDAAALAAGLANVPFSALPANPISIAIPAGLAAATYNGTLTVRNAAGCESAGHAFTLTINPLPTITASANAAGICYSTSAQSSTLAYSATGNAPTHYTLTWSAAAQAAGLTNVASTPLPASPISFPVSAGVASGTYSATLRVINGNGCVSNGNIFSMNIGSLPVINTQPVDRTVCAGNSISFTAAASGIGLTYQWRKGTTNLCNCGNVSGVNTATLTINPAATTDAASDYNVVISSGSCGSVISDYVALTVNTAAATPAQFPKDLTFPAVAPTTVVGSFTPAGDATHYLVIRKTVNVAPTNPTDGVSYTAGTSALTGYIEYAGTNPFFTANGLTPGTTYYYWIYAYNISICGTSPRYNTSSPLSGEVTTGTNVSCGTITNLYWAGAGSGIPGATSGTNFNAAANWSTSTTTYSPSPVPPTECTNAQMNLVNSATITLSSSIQVYALNFTINGGGRTAILSANNNTLTVNGDALIDVYNGNSSSNIYIGENSAGAGIVDFKANFRIGVTNYNSNFPKSYMVGNVNSKIIFRGDVLFGRTARVNLPGFSGYPPSYPLAAPGTGTTPGTIEFDGPGLQQVLWNNNVWYDCFYNIVVGNQNKPYVKHVTGTYTPDNILNNLTINDGCTVDLGASQWIREQQGGTFTMNGSAKLILGNDRSVRSAANTGVVITGSNFPGGFSTLNIDPSSTIEYNGSNSITQTVYGTPAIGSLTYGNLILSNGSGTGNAAKVNSSVVNIAGTATVGNQTTWTMGAGIVSEGTTLVDNGGRLNIGNFVVSGGGEFALQSGGTISLGSASGITSSGNTGNVQTNGGRFFSTGGNYIYSGSTAQATGSGLPTTVNDLTISNSAGVTLHAASANYTVSGTLYLTAGALNINGDTLTVNNLQRNSGTLTGSASSSLRVSGSNVPLFFTSGARTLRHLFLNNNASADLQTSLDLTAGSNAGSVTVGSGATLNTYGNLTLKSNASGTARVGSIPEDGAGNALGTITGNVTIERYIPAKRSWRMMAYPVQSAGAPTINAALQEGVVNPDLNFTNNRNPNPGFGIHITGSSPALGFDPSPLNNASMLTFNRSNGSWTGIANTLSLTVRDYEGYMLFVRGDRSTNMNLNTSASLTNTILRIRGTLRTGRQTISVPGGTGTYSVVGNPFASTIDFRNISTTGGVSSNTFVLWDPALTGLKGVGAYQYFTESGGNFIVFPGGGSYGPAGSVNNLIQAGQAFLVQNSSAGTVIIGESAKNSSSSSTVFRPVPNGMNGRISTLLYAVESDSVQTLVDGALSLYNALYADSIDLDDARKLLNNSENMGIQSGSSLLQIEKRATLSETDTLRYNLRNLKTRNYYFEIEVQQLERMGLEAFLKDQYTGTTTRLEMNQLTRYPFSVTADAASKAQDRFQVLFKNISVLPVTFTDVQAFRSGNDIRVQWTVEQETNIRRYEVEHSADGRSFRKIAEERQPRNLASSQYSITDAAPAAGMHFYRIKTIENSGRSAYSKTVKAFIVEKGAGISVYPNPVTGNQVQLYFSNQPAGTYQARLLNPAGQVLYSGKLIQADGNSQATLNLGNSVPPAGNYLLEIMKPDQTREWIQLLF